MFSLVTTHPAVQSGLLPLAAALLLSVGLGRRAAGAAVGVAYLLSHLAVLGPPPFPPVAAMQKLFYVAAAFLAAGVLLDAMAARRPVRRAVALAAPAAALTWLALPILLRAATPGTWAPGVWLTVAGTLLAAGVAMLRLERRLDDGVTGPVIVVAAAVGTGVVALLGGSASILQLAMAVAAATGGFLLVNWPRQRHRVAAALLLGAGALVPVLAGQLVLYTRTPAVAVALLLPVFFADIVADRLPVRAGAWRPVLLGMLCLVPVLLAVAVAWTAAPVPDAYTG
ncbi:MAG TPA: hypothetical protein VD995_01940 [Azospirillum sp.]|nr:hypothetical protein [Azospirillum sp.]